MAPLSQSPSLLVPERVPAPQPFLKWAGGKSRLLEQYEPHLPDRFGTYHEPFLGGGALFFRLRPVNAVLSDVNPRLIEAWTAIRDEVWMVVERLDALRSAHSPEHFYRARERFNRGRGLQPCERAALLIYLNKTCFNGLYRENARGDFNVPLGSYSDPQLYDLGNLVAVSRRLQGVDLRTQSFEAVLDHAAPGDFVYFDPPYAPLSPTSSFTSYSSGGFGDALQHRLAQVFDELSRRGAVVLLSNSDCPFVRELYRGWRIETVRAPRAISARGAGRGSVNEVLVIGQIAATAPGDQRAA